MNERYYKQRNKITMGISVDFYRLVNPDIRSCLKEEEDYEVFDCGNFNHPWVYQVEEDHYHFIKVLDKINVNKDEYNLFFTELDEFEIVAFQKKDYNEDVIEEFNYKTILKTDNYLITENHIYVRMDFCPTEKVTVNKIDLHKKCLGYIGHSASTKGWNAFWNYCEKMELENGSDHYTIEKFENIFLKGLSELKGFKRKTKEYLKTCQEAKTKGSDIVYVSY